MTAKDYAKAGREAYEKEEQKAKGSTLYAIPASQIATKATRWLWEENGYRWLPMGTLAGLAGREGVGKSTWCAHIIAQITNGKLLSDFHGTPHNVAVVTTEDDWEATVKPRLMAAGADVDRVFKI